MRIIQWDDGTRWDNPNARWGDPSYVLEPGDPGYVAPATPITKPKRRRSKVRRHTYYPLRAQDQVNWLVNVANKLAGYATTLGLSNAERDAIIADCLWLVYVMQSWLGAVRSWSVSCTEAVDEAQTGDGVSVMALPVFTAPALPAGVVPTNTGALDRIFDAVQLIKDAGSCTDAIALDLGFVGGEQTAPDFTTFGPVLKVQRAPAGVTIDWGWQGKRAFLDMIELQVDRGNGFVLLAFDTTPGYVDSEPIPANPTKWKYRGIYRVGDQRVGQWSAEVSVNVGG